MAAKKPAMAGPMRIPVVMLFAETRGFTRTSDMLEPAVVLARIAEFFTLVQTAVEGRGGIVRDVLNDTLAASFGGDAGAKNSAMRAVEAAQDIQREFAAFEESWERDYGIRAAVAIGLHAGDAVIGDIGKPALQQFIIGDSVSIAERLLHRARAGEFVLSEPVMNGLATGEFALSAEELPPLAIPGREPIRLFGVVRDTRLDFT